MSQGRFFPRISRLKLPLSFSSLFLIHLNFQKAGCYLLLTSLFVKSHEHVIKNHAAHTKVHRVVSGQWSHKYRNAALHYKISFCVHRRKQKAPPQSKPLFFIFVATNSPSHSLFLAGEPHHISLAPQIPVPLDLFLELVFT